MDLVSSFNPVPLLKLEIKEVKHSINIPPYLHSYEVKCDYVNI